MIKLVSFSYKNPPSFLNDAHVMEINCRNMANPHHVQNLRHLTGKDPRVQEWVLANGGERLRGYARGAVATGFTIIAFGCIGGKHRSVSLAEIMAKELTAEKKEVEVEHLAL